MVLRFCSFKIVFKRLIVSLSNKISCTVMNASKFCLSFPSNNGFKCFLVTVFHRFNSSVYVFITGDNNASPVTERFEFINRVNLIASSHHFFHLGTYHLL
ncbi:hypothetical protein CW304_16085 [Bacillus sp. UFRGS-B20]|nr:hypothetical protein CW304_16085 [Bacillus sp. UFRGS-B20]